MKRRGEKEKGTWHACQKCHLKAWRKVRLVRIPGEGRIPQRIGGATIRGGEDHAITARIPGRLRKQEIKLSSPYY